MTAQHMGMVYDADGLDGAEKHLLGAYCNRTDDHGYCWPGQDRLADDCGTSIATVKRVKKRLVEKGLIKSIRRVHPRTGEPITNLTRVNIPLLASMKRKPRDYDDNMIEKIIFEGADDRQASAENPPDLLRAHDEPDPGLIMSPTPVHDEPLTLREPSLETSDGDAPAARSAGDGRRPSTGSSAREGFGGSAATRKTPRAKKPKSGTDGRMSRAQSMAVCEVEQGWPAELAALLPEKRPRPIRDAVLDGLRSRTPEQLRKRIERRWHAHGYAEAALSEDGKGLGRPVGVAVALVRPNPDCSDPMCEDGTIADTGAACRACERRRADRRGRDVIPAPRGPRWSCGGPECTVSGGGTPPEDGLCPACRITMREELARAHEHLGMEHA